MTQGSAAFYYEMSPVETRDLLGKADALRIGESSEAIVRQLGMPTYDQTLYDKKDMNKQIHVLKYYVKKKDKDLVNELHDQYVRIELSPSDTLLKVEYINIPR